MARTKQTARKSTGGKAPRMQLASSSARSVKTFFRAQQAIGNSTHTAKKIFINCENTLAGFKFQRTRVQTEFSPVISVARFSHPLRRANLPLKLPPKVAVKGSLKGKGSTKKSKAKESGGEAAAEDTKDNAASLFSSPSDVFIRLDFASSLDGGDDQIAPYRPPIDVVFVVDMSYSMSSPFPDDTDRRTKLAVAKDCIFRVLDKLTERDRASVVAFDTTAETVFPLHALSKARKINLMDALNRVKPRGGTDLAGGLAHGFRVLRDDEDAATATAAGRDEQDGDGDGDSDSESDSEGRMKRVYFLTDMESCQSDEDLVIAIATSQAKMDGWLADLQAKRDARRARAATAPATSTPSTTAAATTTSTTAEDSAGNDKKRKSSTSTKPSKPSAGAKKKAKSATATATATATTTATTTSSFGGGGSFFAGGGGGDPRRFDAIINRTYTRPAHLSVVGIGVDLSIATVERISAIPGAKYISVMNSAELFESVAADFNFEVTPIAFNIRVTCPPGVTICKVFGSAELNALPAGSSEAHISTEFPVRLDSEGCTFGGLYVLQLSVDDAWSTTTTTTTTSSSSSLSSSSSSLVSAAGGGGGGGGGDGGGSGGGADRAITVRWLDRRGESHSTTLPLVLPAPLVTSADASCLHSPLCDSGLRKAHALAHYVDLLTQYVLDDDTSDTNGGGGGGGVRPTSFHPSASSSFRSSSTASSMSTHQATTLPSVAVRTQICELGTEGLLAVPSTEALPADTPASLVKHVSHVKCFQAMLYYLCCEMEDCRDESLQSTNNSILQTIEQIIRLETEEVQSVVNQYQATLGGRAKAATATATTTSTATRRLSTTIEESSDMSMSEDDDDDDVDEDDVDDEEDEDDDEDEGAPPVRGRRGRSVRRATASTTARSRRPTTPVVDVPSSVVLPTDAEVEAEAAVDHTKHPRGMVCPVTLSLMVDPVLAADGHSYERSAIQAWLRTNTVSPVTNLPLSSNKVVRNISLCAAIQEYRAGLPAKVQMQLMSAASASTSTSTSTFTATSTSTSSQSEVVAGAAGSASASASDPALVPMPAGGPPPYVAEVTRVSSDGIGGATAAIDTDHFNDESESDNMVSKVRKSCIIS